MGLGLDAAGVAVAGAPPAFLVGALVELSRVPLVVSDCCWHGATLFCTTVASQDVTGGARVLAVCPPVLDPHLLLAGAESAGPGGLPGTSSAAMVRGGQWLQSVVVPLQAHALPAALPGLSFHR